MCNNNDNQCRCLNEILTTISILQKNADSPENCIDICDRGFLGNSTAKVCFNTRPVMLYTAFSNGREPWTMPISKDATSEEERCEKTSSVFRVEKVDGCCCTFRVLAENRDGSSCSKMPYVATNSFFTMNLNCICCLRCLPDTFVDCI